MTDPGAQFDADYFQRGPETGKSNYVNYSWLPEVTLPCAHRMVEYLGIRHGDLVLDVGAARGYYVKAMRMMGIESHGYDISKWAVENCDPDVQRYMSNDFPKFFPDWATIKDVLEHVPLQDLNYLCERLNRTISKGLLVIVPVVSESGGDFVREEDRMDSTHVIRWTFLEWLGFLEQKFPKFTVSASFHVPGIKPASEIVPHSTAFFKLTK